MSPGAYITIARAGMAALFAWSVSRAVSQSVTPGEAWNYDRYIGASWQDALASFDSNNHVLNTILVRISTWRIHLTELSLRLPSLLCGGLYLAAVYRLARRCFGDGAMFLVVAGLLTLNPMVMDAMSEARGYGMALAAWMWALDLVLESLESFSPQKLNLAGVLLGLSVAASLAFAAPAVALILVAAAWLGKRRVAFLPHLAILTAFTFLVIPLNHAEMEIVTTGAASLRQTVGFLAANSFGNASTVLTWIVYLAGAAVAIWAAIFALRRRDPLTYLAGGSLVVTLLLLWIAHRFGHAAFPEAGAIYLVPVVTLFLAAIPARQTAFLILGTLCVAHYAESIQLPYRAAGRLENGREVAKTLRNAAMKRAVTIATSVETEPIIEYYKRRYKQGNWQVIERFKPEGGYHFYVLTPDDASIVDARRLTVLYRDDGLILAR
jgi:hypothetical protein